MVTPHGILGEDASEELGSQKSINSQPVKSIKLRYEALWSLGLAKVIGSCCLNCIWV